MRLLSPEQDVRREFVCGLGYPWGLCYSCHCLAVSQCVARE